MRKSLLSVVAVAAIAASSVAGAAGPRVVLSLKLTDSTFGILLAPAIVCDSNSVTVCTDGSTYNFTYSSLGGTSGWAGSATLGDFFTFNTSFAGNSPGSNLNGGILSASQNSLQNTLAPGGATGYLQVDLQAFDYTLPSGTAKFLQGSASLTQSEGTTSALDSVQSTFYVDPTNGGGLGSISPTCTITGALNNSCNTGVPQAWTSGVGPYSMRDIINYTLTAGDQIDTTSRAVVTRLPEPGSVALVGLALFAAGAASRRISRKV